MDEKLIELTDGTKLDVKVNFYTLYLIQQSGIDKIVDKKDLSDQEKFDVAAKMVYIILRSNGLKVDEEEAMILTPMNPTDLQNMFEEFKRKVEKYKKKEQAKASYPQKRKKKRKKSI